MSGHGPSQNPNEIGNSGLQDKQSLLVGPEQPTHSRAHLMHLFINGYEFAGQVDNDPKHVSHLKKQS